MILFTPLPPQCTVEHTPERMARLDRRFACPGAWPADPTLLVQDCARVLGAHLTVRTAAGQWHGDPLAPAATPPLTEPEWLTALCLGTLPTVHLAPAHLEALRGWTAGVVTVFGEAGPDGAPRVARVLNLGVFLDRVELDFLLDGGLTGVGVLRAHRVEGGGHLTLWRAQRPAIGRSAASCP